MKMKNIPERIYLQIGAETPKDCNFEELDEVTWCQDRISENDIEYVRVKKVDHEDVRPTAPPDEDVNIRTI